MVKDIGGIWRAGEGIVSEGDGGVATASVRGAHPAILACARIDNRDELADRLSITRGQAAKMDAADLILAAYRRWGEDCPQYLLGDFAFAIQDGPCLLLARDPLGIRPLYISKGKGWLAFGTNIHSVLAQPGVCAQISNQAILSYLVSGGFHDQHLTLYQDVEKLPPAHTLSIDPNGSQLKRYWHPEKTPRRVRTAHHREELRELLKDAVKVRLPAAGPVATHLSGGLDSSAITALAASQLDDRSRLQAYSWMRPPANEEEVQDPEWSLAIAVAKKCGIPLHFTPFTPEHFSHILERRPLLDNDSADLWYEFPLRERLQEQGTAVVLSGWGGDQFISNSGVNSFLEGLLSSRLMPTLADLGGMARQSRRPWRAALSLTRHQVVAPLLAHLRWRLSRAPFNGWGDAGLAFTTADFQRWAREASATVPRVQPKLQLREAQLQELVYGTVYNRVEAWAASGARAGVEYRYPLLDKRIVEFALGLPPEQYRGAGMSRRLFIETVSEFLPEVLRYGGIKYEPRRVQEGYGVLRAGVRQYFNGHPTPISPHIDVQQLERVSAAMPPFAKTVTQDTVLSLIQVTTALAVANLNGDLQQIKGSPGVVEGV